MHGQVIFQSLTSTSDEDVITTLYPETALGPQPGEKGTVSNKVNSVCDAMIAHFKKDITELNVQNIITAYVCKVPADLESAISLIATLKGLQSNPAVLRIGLTTGMSCRK